MDRFGLGSFGTPITHVRVCRPRKTRRAAGDELRPALDAGLVTGSRGPLFRSVADHLWGHCHSRRHPSARRPAGRVAPHSAYRASRQTACPPETAPRTLFPVETLPGRRRPRHATRTHRGAGMSFTLCRSTPAMRRTRRRSRALSARRGGVSTRETHRPARSSSTGFAVAAVHIGHRSQELFASVLSGRWTPRTPAGVRSVRPVPRVATETPREPRRATRLIQNLELLPRGLETWLNSLPDVLLQVSTDVWSTWQVAPQMIPLSSRAHETLPAAPRPLAAPAAIDDGKDANEATRSRKARRAMARLPRAMDSCCCRLLPASRAHRRSLT